MIKTLFIVGNSLARNKACLSVLSALRNTKVIPALQRIASAVFSFSPLALRQTADGWSLFVGPPGLTSPLLRLAARKAGVHLFTEQDCNVYANGPFLVLHAAQDGPLVITGRRGELVDLLSGQRIGPGAQVTVELQKGDTRILRVTE